jgi:hypothetical protein
MVVDGVDSPVGNGRQLRFVHEIRSDGRSDRASGSATDHTAAGGGICQKPRSAPEPGSDSKLRPAAEPESDSKLRPAAEPRSSPGHRSAP